MLVLMAVFVLMLVLMAVFVLMLVLMAVPVTFLFMPLLLRMQFFKVVESHVYRPVHRGTRWSEYPAHLKRVAVMLMKTNLTIPMGE